MRRSSQETKALILSAARERFAAAGFEGATIRAIAADAGIDPAMVMRYYGSKNNLFAAAAEFNLKFPKLSDVDPERVGDVLVSHFLDRWEGPGEDGEALIVLLRSSTTNEEAMQRMREIFVSQLEPMAGRVVPKQAALRASLVATQMLGFALCRYVLRLAPVVNMSREEVVSWLGPTIQRYLSP